MPFKSEKYGGVFTPEELLKIQQAYDKCCEILNPVPMTDEQAQQVARLVLESYEKCNGEVQETVQRVLSMVKIIL